MPYEVSVENRLTRLETLLDEIKNNHLAHLEMKVDRITWILVTSLVALSVDLLMRIYG